MFDDDDNDGFKVVSFDEAERILTEKLMEGYGELVMQVDDPRDIAISKDKAKDLAARIARMVMMHSMAETILQCEFMKQRAGFEPAPWFTEMMKTPAPTADEWRVIVGQMGIQHDNCDCDQCEAIRNAIERLEDDDDE